MDQELFELCKDVYERTGWDDTDNELSPKGHLWPRGGFKDFHRGSIEEPTPLYTSDYLLEKLPKSLPKIDGFHRDIIMDTGYLKQGFVWRFGYDIFDDEEKVEGFGDTPLKALLKLTIALHKAGELS